MEPSKLFSLVEVIDKFYVGGETEDSTVTGVIDTVNTNLIGVKITKVFLMMLLVIIVRILILLV